MSELPLVRNTLGSDIEEVPVVKNGEAMVQLQVDPLLETKPGTVAAVVHCGAEWECRTPGVAGRSQEVEPFSVVVAEEVGGEEHHHHRGAGVVCWSLVGLREPNRHEAG